MDVTIQSRDGFLIAFCDIGACFFRSHLKDRLYLFAFDDKQGHRGLKRDALL